MTQFRETIVYLSVPKGINYREPFYVAKITTQGKIKPLKLLKKTTGATISKLDAHSWVS